MRRTWRLAQHALAELLGRTVQELRATMTLPEFFSWQAYARHKAIEAARPAPPRPLAALDGAAVAGMFGRPD